MIFPNPIFEAVIYLKQQSAFSSQRMTPRVCVIASKPCTHKRNNAFFTSSKGRHSAVLQFLWCLPEKEAEQVCSPPIPVVFAEKEAEQVWVGKKEHQARTTWA